MRQALAALPDTHLFELIESLRTSDRRYGYDWLLAVLRNEEWRRSSMVEAEFPAHGLPQLALAGAASNLWDFADRIVRNPDGVGLRPMVRVLLAAVAHLGRDVEGSVSAPLFEFNFRS